MPTAGRVEREENYEPRLLNPPLPHAAGTVYFEMDFNDGVLAVGSSPPDRLSTVSCPQERVLPAHCGADRCLCAASWVSGSRSLLKLEFRSRKLQVSTEILLSWNGHGDAQLVKSLERTERPSRATLSAEGSALPVHARRAWERRDTASPGR